MRRKNPVTFPPINKIGAYCWPFTRKRGFRYYFSRLTNAYALGRMRRLPECIDRSPCPFLVDSYAVFNDRTSRNRVAYRRRKRRERKRDVSPRHKT
jgi:hypothetical protein